VIPGEGARERERRFGRIGVASSRWRGVAVWLDFQWRRVTTGLCFLTFMAGALVLALVALPLLHLTPLSPQKKRAISLKWVQRAFRLFMRFMRWLGGMASFEIEGLAALEGGGPYLFIANHPALIDVVAIMSVIPRCNCLVKDALFQHPFFGGVLRRAGFLRNGSGPDLIERARRELEDGVSLIVFPEGTRSPRRGLHPFNRGAAQIAVRTGVPVAPVLVSCEPPTLMKGQPWHDVPERPVDFRLRFFPPMKLPEEAMAEMETPLRVRAINRHFEAFFRDALTLPREPDGKRG